MHKLKNLKPGGTIGIVSPARTAPADWIKAGKAGLEKLGFKVVVHPQNSLKHHQLAGTPEQRAQALMEMFADPAIDAIMCARGGIGSYQLLPHIDFDVIRKNPKIFCGFSDITTLLTAFYTQAKLPGFHGPMCWNFVEGAPELAKDIFEAFTGHFRPHHLNAHTVQEGMAEGKLVGGNITLLQNLVGTKWDLDTRDCILFLEDTEEKWSDVDRALTHLYHAGKFASIRGLIIGEMTDMVKDPKGDWGHDYRQLLRGFVPAHVPIVSDFPCGHGKRLLPFPLGCQAKLEITGKSTGFTLLTSPFA